MGSSSGSDPATVIEQSHAGAPLSCTICLKNTGTRPARSLGHFLPPFSHPATNDWALEVQKRGAAPSAAHRGQLCKVKSVGKLPRRALRRRRGAQGWDRDPRVRGSAPYQEMGSLRPGMQPARARGYLRMRGCSRLRHGGTCGCRGAAGSGTGVPADAAVSGTGCRCSFFGGPVVYFVAVTTSQYWQGNGVSKRFESLSSI